MMVWLAAVSGTVPNAEAQECPSVDADSGNTFSRRKTEKGKLLYWATRYVEVEAFLSNTPKGITSEYFKSMIKNAETSWENVGCTNFEFGDQVPDAPSSATNLINDGFDGARCKSQYDISTNAADCINRIVFRTSKDPESPFYWPQSASDPRWVDNCSQDDCTGSNPDGTLALTTTLFNEATGRIIDADMDLNASSGWTWDEYTLGPVMIHEFGHVLGFGHICNTRDSIMDPSYRFEAPTLNEDNDKNAICTTYPWDSITPESGNVILSGIQGGCQVDGPMSPWASWIWLCALACWVLRRRATYACKGASRQ